MYLCMSTTSPAGASTHPLAGSKRRDGSQVLAWPGSTDLGLGFFKGIGKPHVLVTNGDSAKFHFDFRPGDENRQVRTPEKEQYW